MNADFRWLLTWLSMIAICVGVGGYRDSVPLFFLSMGLGGLCLVALSWAQDHWRRITHTWRSRRSRPS